MHQVIIRRYNELSSESKLKGFEEWSNSAPHGAGRVLSRKKARAELDLDQMKEDMKGINTWSVSEETLDESPRAYRDIDEIISAIGDTVEDIRIFKSVFNFKGGQD